MHKVTNKSKRVAVTVGNFALSAGQSTDVDNWPELSQNVTIAYYIRIGVLSAKELPKPKTERKPEQYPRDKEVPPVEVDSQE